MVEEVIRKICSDQRYGVHDRATGNSWVRFSLRMIWQELRARGKTRSIPAGARSIEILKRSIVEVQVKIGSSKKAAYSDPILISVTTVSRADFKDILRPYGVQGSPPSSPTPTILWDTASSTMGCS